MAKILITPKSFKEAGEKAYKILSESGYTIFENTTGKTLSEEQMIEMCRDVDGLIVGVDPVTEKVMLNSPKLKAISKYGVGLDNIDLEAAEKLGIKVEKAVGTNSNSVAELAVGLIFALSRKIIPAAISTRNDGWDRMRGIELRGKTVGILGFGSIGREVARMAYGLGMQILTYDPLLSCDIECEGLYKVSVCKIEDVIKNSDFLTLHLPLTKDTKHIINKNTISLMKPTSFIINTSRGELIDELALYEALSQRIITGAASDVFSSEPPKGNPILSLDNFILTPHIGAYTVEANEKMAVKSVENLVIMLDEKVCT